MNINDFKIYEKDNKQIIEKLVYPRFTAEIAFNSPTSDLDNVKFIDKSNDVMLIAKVMREAGEYLLSKS